MKINKDRLLNDRKYCENIFRFLLRNKVIILDKFSIYEKHMNKAIKNLEFANFLLDEHKYSIKKKLPGLTFFDWCVTIYYYSLYHAALALVSKSGYKSGSHLSTITLITLFYYHKDNILKRKEIEFLINNISLEKTDINLVLNSKGLREKASYGADESFQIFHAKQLQKQTADFVNKINDILKNIN